MGQRGRIGRRQEEGIFLRGNPSTLENFLNAGGWRLSFVSEALVEALVDGYCPRGWLSGK